MKKHKFTWIDAFVLVVVVLLIVGTCVKFLAKEPTAVTQETIPFSYQLKISNVRGFTADSLQIGDTVYDNEGKGAVGVITDIQAEPAVSTYTTSAGEIREAQVEDRYDLTLTLSAEGVAAGSTYKVGTYTIHVNQSAIYFTKYSTWNARIISID